MEEKDGRDKEKEVWVRGLTHIVKPRENPNFLKNDKMVISVKIQKFSRSRMKK